MKDLSIVALAFSFLNELQISPDLPFCHSSSLLGGNMLARLLNDWDGKSSIWIPEDIWLIVLTKLTVGHKTSFDSATLCLVSD